MTDNSFLSLIQRLNSGDSPSTATATSPSDHNDDLSLWTNAEFTFDMPPGFGIFDTDSGLNNNNNDIASTSTANPLTLAHNNDPILGHQPASTSSSLDLLSLTPSQTEPRALSLLERTRQRNPLQDENSSQQQQQQQPKLELQEQLAAINSFHSLLAAYSAAQTQQQQQQIHQQQTQEYPSIQPAAVTVTPVSTAAPTTPAAAKLLRQPMPKYDKPALLSKKEKIESSPSTTLQPVSQPQSIESASQDIAASNVASNDENDDVEETEQQSGAGAVTSNDDPDNQTPKLTPQEDKRRRNTAASARFRQKKKLREQALEQTAQEQAARAASLEARVKELEMEVRWLRGLIVEKDSRLHEATVSLADSKRIRLESP